ncbi:MAG: hypothetical protein LIO77_10950 [Rikenellaceae bacterium]|nr:hypothetical protein [Rikenellaceae bacterium]
MKKLTTTLVLGLCMVGTAGAQTDLQSVTTANYYGIDFSHTKVFGASETDTQFRNAFTNINILVIEEGKKYNLANAFGKNFPIQNFETANSRVILNQDLRTSDKTYRIGDDQLGEILSAYGGNDQGVGLLIICQLLNKQDNQGVWKVVLFDIPTKEIIYTKDVSGKAGGFGLRNFWAGSLYQVLKKWKY